MISCEVSDYLIRPMISNQNRSRCVEYQHMWKLVLVYMHQITTQPCTQLLHNMHYITWYHNASGETHNNFQDTKHIKPKIYSHWQRWKVKKRTTYVQWAPPTIHRPKHTHTDVQNPHQQTHHSCHCLHITTRCRITHMSWECRSNTHTLW